ncbi:beta strand repeat-containing protein, partial [Planktotalea frisia]|uniref:beta strand repeat-containing protein n=1 Tax=Planktotalea frisia TaxID=696762 RepID=UPI00111474FE
ATSSVADINDAPTGAVTISGTATQGQVLTAVSKLADADGLGTLSYQWKADSVAISGATSNTLTLGQSQVGKVITVAVSYTDGGGTVETKTSAATSLVTNINDAPILTVPKDGSVTEDASTPTISGSLVGADPDDDILTYVVPNAAAEDGSFSVAGTYGTLVLNASTGAYTYTLDNSAAAVQALGASSSETETFSVQVMDGSSTTAAQPLSFTIKGANDAPEAISLSSTVVGNNEIGPVVGELGSTDVDGLEVSYTLSGTDEAVFELDGSSLKFKDSVTVDTSIKATYNVIVTATDSEAGAISKSFEITVSDVDSRPFIREFKTSTKDGSYNQSSSDIVITAVMSENVSKNSTFNANLNNNVELTFNYVENSGNMLTATYAISEGDDIDDLAIISYDKGSVTDLSDLRMSSSSKEFVLGEIDIDTIAPTATVSQATAAKFTIGDDGSGTLVITGANFSSIAAVDSSVKSILDWSKVTWDVNGTGSGGGADLTFSSDNIASAVLTDTETITVKLTNETIATLQGRASFGGTTEGGEVSDTLDIAAGFLRDVAGNQASQAAISVTIVPTDVTPGAIDATELVPTNHTVSGEQTFLNISSQGVGDSLRLALDFDSDLLLDSSMLVTFNNGGTATLSRDESEASRLVGSYTVSSLDDDEAALAIQSITLNDTRDIYGNVISNADVIAALDEKLAQVTVDTTAPTATVSQATAAKFTIGDDGSGTLVITGANFSSIAAVDSSVKSILDWSKVTWDVNGTGSGGGADLTFSSDNIASAVLTDTETITVKLTNETIATLQGRASFGGTTEGGEVSDTLDIAAGFLRDVAGNQASQAAISVTIVPTDVTPGAIDATELVPTNHTVSGEQTFLNISSQGVGDSLRLALDFDSDLLLDSSMLVTFNNGGTATLSRDESEASRLVGSYTVSSLDDDEAALAIQSITLNDTRDIYGNVISNADVIAALDEKLAQVTVDTTAPNVVALRYTETGDNAGLLEFIFNEKLSNEDTVGEHLISLSYTALKYESLVTEKTQIYKFNNLLEGSDFANAERTALDIGKLSLIDLAGNEFTYDDETSVFELIIL